MKNIIAIGVLLTIFSCSGKKTIEGDQYYEQGKYAEALESYNKYLTVYPRNAKTLYNRARTQEKLGNIEFAINDLDNLLKLDPNHLSGRISLGELRFNMGDYDKAFYEFNLAVKSHKQNSTPYAYRAKSYQMLGKVKEAKKDYGVAIRLDPSNAMAYLYRGTLYISQKKKTAACKDFKKAQQLGVEEAEKAISKYCKR